MTVDGFRFAVGQRVLCKADLCQGRTGTVSQQWPRTDLTDPPCYMVDMGNRSQVFCREDDLEAIPEAPGEAGPDK